MAATAEDAPFSFESGHSDLIHDVQIDFYGKTLASASSDRVIRIFEIIKNSHRLLATLQGHSGPVWKVSWCHPNHGTMIASCGYDRKVIVWKCSAHQKWSQMFVDQFPSSVNTVQFSPSTDSSVPLELIAGGSDGSIRVYSLSKKGWSPYKRIESAHNGGVNSISWAAPTNIIMANKGGAENNAPREVKRFVSGGCDHLVKVWNFEHKSDEYLCTAEMNEHEDWVRDVAWSPIPTSTSHSVVASCSEDKSVIIWKEQNRAWTAAERIQCEAKVWSVSWSELGNVLAVAFGENTVHLYKEGNDGKWHNVTRLN